MQNKKHLKTTIIILSNMTPINISKEIENMWIAYQRLCSVWDTLENPESEINDSILDIISQNPEIGSPPCLAAFGNYLKFMLSNQKDGIQFQPTEKNFNDWYKYKNNK